MTLINPIEVVEFQTWGNDLIVSTKTARGRLTQLNRNGDIA